MNLQDDPGAVFRELKPEPPPAAFDLDRIVRDGYKVRRRHRAVLGGAVTAGVAAVAAVFSMSLVGLPGVRDDEGDPNEAAESTAAEPDVIEDPSMAGYPYDHAWENPVDPETNAIVTPEEAQTISDDATAAFGQLLADAGAWDDPLNTVDTGECEYLAEMGYEEEDCEDVETGLPVGPHQRPGNYGQTWLRSYVAEHSEEDGGGVYGGLRDVFKLEVLLPGGWTAEPGPVTEQLFPQHLISAGEYYTDTAPEFETSTLEDGRTLMIANHGCAYDLAVVYPNGTALRVSWDVGCNGAPTRPVSLEELTDAVLAMPEYEFDTSALTEVDELMEIPTGWVDDHGWEDSEVAEADAEATIDLAADALAELYPDATLGDADARTLGISGRGAVTHRSYYGGGTLPFETTIDTTTGPVNFDLRYYLPGGWVPGVDQFFDRGPYIAGCTEFAECTGPWFDEDGTGWAAEEEVSEHQPSEEEGGGGPIVDHTLELTMFHPDGWAVSIWATWTGDTPIDADVFEEILRAMPAPVYDADAVPEIPAGVDD
jgi:hypothetical protein